MTDNRFHDYYRVHADPATFSAENAYSTPWGGDEAELDCGYSCFDDLPRFVKFWKHEDDSSNVVVFSGQRVGTGPDNEDLVVPDFVRVEWTTLDEVRKSFDSWVKFWEGEGEDQT